MRTLLIATALAGMTASAAGAQMAARAPHGGMPMGGGQHGGQMGGQWHGGGSVGGGWTGGGHTNVRVNTSQSQSQSQSQWQGQRQSGGWNGRPTPPRVGGDPRPWGPGNQPGGWHGGGNHQGGNQQWSGGSNWGGGYTGGRWNAGNRAPGGWNAYHRPQRGWTMPGYWRSRDFRILNFGFFGLQTPPAGYGWSRYYDDAVLVDDYGRVYDSVGGLDWGGYHPPYDDGYGYPSQGYANAPDAYYQGQSDGRCRRRGKGSGIGGAIVGGAIGAGVGALTGGLGTILIAGGATALAGQQVDRESRARIVCDNRADDDSQGGYDQSYAGQSGQAYAGDGYAYAQGGQGGYSYGYAPGVSATATVDFDVPVTTTTTTTTTTEEWVPAPRQRVIYRTYIKKVPVYRKPMKVWRQTKPSDCGDSCGGS